MSSELKTEIAGILKGKPANVYTVKDVVKAIVRNTGTVSSDDVRFYVDEFEPSSQVIGAVFQNLVQAGFLEKVDDRKSTVPSSHGRSISVFAQAN